MQLVNWLKVACGAFSGMTRGDSVGGGQKAWFLPACRALRGAFSGVGRGDSFGGGQKAWFLPACRAVCGAFSGVERGRWGKVLAVLCLAGAPAIADVLPDDRADVLYHNYTGGGITIQGPSVLVRKKVGDNLSFTENYYEDLISSASIDVRLSASPYHETRKQESGSVDYLHGKTIYTAGYIHSREPDYKSDTAYFSISQSMFGDLTTVSMGYRRGWDNVYRDVKVAGVLQNDPTFHERADHRGYSVSVSQILTRNAILDVNFEAITDQGYLASPYRKIRYLDPTVAGKGFTLADQIYPNTRTSTATSAQFKYYLPWHAAVTGQYRFYNDTWGITGHTIEVDYTHPWRKFIFDGSLRYYLQNPANFYSDLFPRANYQNFMARDRELAAFHSIAIGLGGEWDFDFPWIRKKSSLNLHYNHLLINYSDFRDALLAGDGTYTAGNEPLYKLNANVLQLFWSLWF